MDVGSSSGTMHVATRLAICMQPSTRQRKVKRSKVGTNQPIKMHQNANFAVRLGPYSQNMSKLFEPC